MKKKQIIIIGSIIGIVLIGLLVLLISRISKKNVVQKTDSNQEQVVIPTVDSSVQVNLVSKNSAHQVTLSVNAIPNSTESLEYEISYKASNREAPGIFSVLQLDPGQKQWEKTFDVGTCSSGTCIFDQVVNGKMKVTIKFTGSYGEKLFEKEYSI